MPLQFFLQFFSLSPYKYLDKNKKPYKKYGFKNLVRFKNLVGFKELCSEALFVVLMFYNSCRSCVTSHFQRSIIGDCKILIGRFRVIVSSQMIWSIWIQYIPLCIVIGSKQDHSMSIFTTWVDRHITHIDSLSIMKPIEFSSEIAKWWTWRIIYGNRFLEIVFISPYWRHIDSRMGMVLR